MVKLKGRGTEIDKLTTKDLRNSEIRKCTSKERSRKWETFLKLQSGSDGLAYHLEPNFLIKNPLPLNMDPKLLGKACSLFSGHCNLNLHRYRLGLSFSPTCVCLQEDETVSHHLFRCPNYASLREKLDISQRSLCIQQVIQYCTSTNRLWLEIWILSARHESWPLDWVLATRAGRSEYGVPGPNPTLWVLYRWAKTIKTYTAIVIKTYARVLSKFCTLCYIFIILCSFDRTSAFRVVWSKIVNSIFLCETCLFSVL